MVLSQLEVTGAEVYASSISDELIARGHKVFIVSDTLTISTKAKYFPIALNKRRLHLQIGYIIKLVKIIKQNKIMVLHAHSRIAGKLGYIAAKLCGIPMIYTAHGKQHESLSKKYFPAYGDYSIAICENVQKQIVEDLRWNSEKTEIIRNGIDDRVFNSSYSKNELARPVVSIIGRLSGPKGDTAYKVLEEICNKKPLGMGIDIRVIGGSIIPERFSVFKHAASFSGFAGNVRDQIANSSVIIGSGRVAMESLMMGKPTIALGEAKYEGLVTEDNLRAVEKSNFGDVSLDESICLDNLRSDIDEALKMGGISDSLKNKVVAEFNLTKATDRIESLYQEFYSRKKYEVPVLLYHRIITDKSQAGKHGTYITLHQIEAHFKYLKHHGYSTITFEELSLIKRFDQDKKYVMLTFDDGYRDNYTLLMPLLEKYGLKATVFMVTGKAENSWDLKDEGRTFPLLTSDQIIEMSKKGVEFGAHTVTHADLTQVGIEEAWKEISESKKNLENLLGKRINSFAYPYGRTSAAIQELVKKAGFTYGIGTVNGPLAMHQDKFNIRRIVIHPNTTLVRFARKVKGNYVYKKNKGFVYNDSAKTENNVAPVFSRV